MSRKQPNPGPPKGVSVFDLPTPIFPPELPKVEYTSRPMSIADIRKALKAKPSKEMRKALRKVHKQLREHVEKFGHEPVIFPDPWTPEGWAQFVTEGGKR